MMQVREVMTSPVVTVAPGTAVREIAKLLLEHRISAVPVTDADQQILGLVSEADLMARPEIAGEMRDRWWLRLFATDASLAHDYVKAHGLRAEDVMTGAVVSVAPDAGLDEAVAQMDRKGVRRCLVVENGRLAGVVSRADLLRGFVAAGASAAVGEQDRMIKATLLAELRHKPWTSINASRIFVADGVVRFSGGVGSDDERQALRVAAESIPGVRGVEDHTFLRSQAPFAD
jgi:CBS domain-containing protein